MSKGYRESLQSFFIYILWTGKNEQDWKMLKIYPNRISASVFLLINIFTDHFIRYTKYLISQLHTTNLFRHVVMLKMTWLSSKWAIE